MCTHFKQITAKIVKCITINAVQAVQKTALYWAITIQTVLKQAKTVQEHYRCRSAIPAIKFPLNIKCIQKLNNLITR